MSTFEVVHYLVDTLGADVNAYNENDEVEKQPIVNAARRCQPLGMKMVRLLLEYGAYLDPLIGLDAIFDWDINEQLDLVKLLVDFGLDVNFGNEQEVDLSLTSSLYKSDPAELTFKYICEQGLNLNYRGMDDTWFDYAILNDDFKMVKYLYYIGFNIDDKAIRDLLKNMIHSYYNKSQHDWRSVLDLPVIENFIQNLSDDKDTPFHHAYWGPQSKFEIEMVKYIVQKGFKIETVNKEGKTSLTSFVENKDIEAARYFMSLGANPHHYDSGKMTPCFHAIKTNNIDMIQMMSEEFHVRLSDVVKMKFYPTYVRPYLSQSMQKYIEKRIKAEQKLQNVMTNNKRSNKSATENQESSSSSVVKVSEDCIRTKKKRRKHQ